MAPEVTQWTLTLFLLLALVWIGFMAYALSWLLSHPLIALSLFGAVAALAYAVARQ